MGGRILFTKESHRIVVGLMGLILSNVDRTNSSGLRDADRPRGYAPEPLIVLEWLTGNDAQLPGISSPGHIGGWRGSAVAL